MFERFTWELRATLVGNHNARRQGTPNRKDLKPKRHLKAQRRPHPMPHHQKQHPSGALHPLRNRAPDQGHCTRYGTVHPIRGTAPDQKRCIAYGSGAAPQHTRTNAELANRAAPGPHNARAEHTKQPRPRPTGIGDEAGAGSAGKRGSAYSLTPPAVRPETMYFCRYWNSRITGMAAITEPAAKMPHGATFWSDAHMYMPTARVN